MTSVTGGTNAVVARRRVLLGALASATALALARCATGAPGHAATPAPPGPPPTAGPPQWPTVLGPPPGSTRVLLPAGGVLSSLPAPVAGQPGLLALTLDDGVDSDVVAAYGRLAHDTGIRLTMFVTGCNRSWTANRELLAPLVQSGQLQLANHTWRHPDLTTLTAAGVADELRHTDRFLADTFGVDATPYFRPPYGAVNDLVRKVAGDLGYTVCTLWDGTLGDDAVLPPEAIVANAGRYYTPGRLVIGHLNHPAVTGVYHQLVELIAQRALRTVTLADVYLRPEVTRLTSDYPGSRPG